MKKYIVNVNGNSYEVEIEEVGAETVNTPVSAPAPKSAPKTINKTAAPAKSSGGEAVSAPMPGTILDIKVSVGDMVKYGDTVAVLEAMKMENDIPATKDGKVLSIDVQKGASVNSGDPIITIG